MRRLNRNVIALATAIAGTTLLGSLILTSRASAATAVWIDPADPTGLGTDPSPAANLTAAYESTSHWNIGAVPGLTASITFNAPGYPGVPYTVTFTQNETANSASIINDPVSFKLGGLAYNLTQTTSGPGSASLLIADQSSLFVQNGTLNTQSIQVGASSGTESSPTFLTVDGSTASLNVADGSTISNFQAINLTHGATLSLGANVFVNQAPDFATSGTNGTDNAIIAANGTGSSLILGDGEIISGGILRATNGGGISAVGASLTYDSLYYDADLALNSANFTMNLSSSRLDNLGNTIPTTITGIINIDGLTVLNIGGTVQLTPDSGNTWNSLTIVGNTQLNIQNANLTTGVLNLDGDGAPGTGSTTTIDPSLVTVHNDMMVGELGNAIVNITAGSTINIDGALFVGDQEGSTGTLTVSGLGTSISTALNTGNSNSSLGDLYVGNGGAGVMTIAAGASVTITNGSFAYIGANDNGDGTGGTGTLTVTGIAFNVSGSIVQTTLDIGTGSGDLHVGDGNNTVGSLLVNNGGYVYDVNADVGINPGATGSVLVDGGFSNLTAATFTLSKWLNAGSIIIGDAGTGSLTVSGGATASSGTSFFIGGNTGSQGTVLVMTGGILQVDTNNSASESLTVGDAGAGTLAIQSGGVVNSHYTVVIGANDTGSGSVTVDGTGSQLNAAAELDVGQAGAGKLSLTNGALVTNTIGRIGTLAGSTGNVTVDNATWSNSSFLEIADSGNATLTIQNGGVVTANDVNLSFFAGSVSSATVDNASWLDSGFLTVANGGNATLTIRDGASVSDTNANIGFNNGATGLVTIDGSNSTWTNFGFLQVASAGNGTLHITGGAAVSDNFGGIARDLGSIGNVTVDNALWNNTGEIRVANAGAGTLILTRAANVISSADLDIATLTGAQGYVSLNASTISLQSFLTVGDAGVGSLQILNGSRFNAPGTIVAGAQTGSSGTILIDASALTCNSFTAIGLLGTGQLTIQNAGTLTQTSSGVIGNSTGSHGHALITGAGSLWNASFLEVGVDGNATLTIQNGAHITNTNGGTLGSDATGVGTALITDPGTMWNVGFGMLVGSSGAGTLTIQNGALLTNASNGYVGFSAGASGVATVTGSGSQWTNAVQLGVGILGTGTLTIAAGGLVTAAPGNSVTGSAAVIGDQNNAVGVATVTDPGSHLALSGHLNVGFGNNGVNTSNGGTGTLNILNAGLVSDINGYVGRYAGSSGAALISGNNALWQNSGGFFIAANDTANNASGQTLTAGTGIVTVGAGGSITAAGSATIGPAGTLIMQGGSFTAAGTTVNGLIEGGGTIFGPISGSGTVQADTAATLSTDSLNIASLIVNGTLVIRHNASGNSTSRVSTLTLAGVPNVWTGKLDLTANNLIVAGGGDSNVVNQIKQAANLGQWSGDGITSSSAHASLFTSTATALAYATGAEFTAATGLTTFAGQSFSPADTLIKYTLAGDANMDGSVTFADFLALQNNYNKTGDWSQGDWNYDGQVTFADFLILQNNYNKTLPSSPLFPALSPQSSVLNTSSAPEPASLALTLLGATALMARGSRHRRRS